MLFVPSYLPDVVTRHVVCGYRRYVPAGALLLGYTCFLADRNEPAIIGSLLSRYLLPR